MLMGNYLIRPTLIQKNLLKRLIIFRRTINYQDFNFFFITTKGTSVPVSSISALFKWRVARDPQDRKCVQHGEKYLVFMYWWTSSPMNLDETSVNYQMTESTSNNEDVFHHAFTKTHEVCHWLRNTVNWYMFQHIVTHTHDAWHSKANQCGMDSQINYFSPKLSQSISGGVVD